MTGSTLAVVVIPIVVAIVLAGWISAVFYANAHPRRKHPHAARNDVAGGTFRAVEGGRQLMPIPERPVDVPGPRSAADEAQPESGEMRPAAERPLAGSPPR
jgi:hypothetical protein